MSAPALAAAPVESGPPFPRAVKDPGQRARYLAGLCIYCGEEPIALGRSCAGERCKAAQREYGNARHHDLRSRRLCVQCGKKPWERGKRCETCYRKLRQHIERGEARRIAAGLCERCTTPRSDRSRRLCDRHLDLSEQRDREREAKIIAGRSCECGATAIVLRKDGSPGCGSCRLRPQNFRALVHGTRAAHESGCRCPSCLDAFRAYNLAKQRKRRAGLLAGKGPCRCGATTKLCLRRDGRVTCKTCLNGERQGVVRGLRETSARSSSEARS